MAGIDSPPDQRQAQHHAALRNKVEAMEAADRASGGGATLPDGGAKLRQGLADARAQLAAAKGSAVPPRSPENIESFPVVSGINASADLGQADGGLTAGASGSAARGPQEAAVQASADVEALAANMGGLAVGGGTAAPGSAAGSAAQAAMNDNDKVFLQRVKLRQQLKTLQVLARLHVADSFAHKPHLQIAPLQVCSCRHA